MIWIQKNAWLFLFMVGLVLLAYAYDNIFAIPQLAPDDPDRGWSWLTRDPDVIDISNGGFARSGFGY